RARGRGCRCPDRLLAVAPPPSASPPPLSKGLLPRRGTSLSTAVLLALGGTPSLPCVYTGHASLLARKKRTLLIPSIPARWLVLVEARRSSACLPKTAEVELRFVALFASWR